MDVPLAGGAPRVRARRVFVRAALAPSGRLAVNRLTAGLHVQSLEVSDPRRVLERSSTNVNPLLSPVAWLPGERELLVENSVRLSKDGSDVEVIDVETRRRRILARRVDAVHGVSRDGKHVLVSRRRGGPRLLSIPIASGGRARVLARNAENPSWSR